jgi:hypothetical protein
LGVILSFFCLYSKTVSVGAFKQIVYSKSLNPGAETVPVYPSTDHQRPTTLFYGTYHASDLYIRHTPRPGQHLLMHLWSQATVDIHHAARSSLFLAAPTVLKVRKDGEDGEEIADIGYYISCAGHCGG